MERFAAVFSLAATSVFAASLSGQWKLDPARSHMDPPVRLIWEASGPKTYKHTSPSYKQVPWPVDGTPLPSPTEEGVLVTRTRVSERVIEEVRMRNGKPISKIVRTVSPDGRRLTVAGNGANSEGETFSYTTHYSRIGTPGRDALAGTWEEDFFAQAKEPIVVTISDTPQLFGVTGKGYSWSAPFSGMQAPVKLAWADHVHLDRVSDGHITALLTKASRVTRDEDYSLSKDGQTLTIRRKMPGAKPARGFVEIYVRVR